MESDDRLWGYKLNTTMMTVVGVVVLLQLSRFGGFSLFGVPVAALFSAYVVAIVILVEWAFLHLWARKVPHVPLLPRRLAGRKSVLVGLCLYLAFITLAREGAFSCIHTHIQPIQHYIQNGTPN